MHILTITYAFAPISVPATFRLLKWFSYLTTQGHRIKVAYVDPASNRERNDQSLTQLIPEGIEELRIWSPEESLPYRLMRRAEPWLIPIFEPRKREWYSSARNSLSKECLQDFDLLFTCSQPPVCHLLGLWARQKASLPWVAFFSDPWAGNPYHTARSRLKEAYNARLERKVVEAADQLVFTSDETRNLVMRRYPGFPAEATHVLNHCFVPEWFLRASPDTHPKRPGTRVLLTGNFYGKRSPMPFLRMLAALRMEQKLPPNVTFEFYGFMTPEDASSPLWCELEGTAVFFGPVSYLESLQLMRAADALLLIDAPVDAGAPSVFFPSKLAEYIGSNRPIIAITPARGTTSRILGELGHPTIEHGNQEGFCSLVGRLARGEPIHDPGASGRDQFSYQSVGKKLMQILASSVSNPR